MDGRGVSPRTSSSMLRQRGRRPTQVARCDEGRNRRVWALDDERCLKASRAASPRAISWLFSALRTRIQHHLAAGLPRRYLLGSPPSTPLGVWVLRALDHHDLHDWRGNDLSGLYDWPPSLSWPSAAWAVIHRYLPDSSAASPGGKAVPAVRGPCTPSVGWQRDIPPPHLVGVHRCIAGPTRQTSWSLVTGHWTMQTFVASSTGSVWRVQHLHLTRLLDSRWTCRRPPWSTEPIPTPAVFVPRLHLRREEVLIAGGKHNSHGESGECMRVHQRLLASDRDIPRWHTTAWVNA